MEHLIKTIAEVKSALDQATELLDEVTTLKEEIKSLKASPTSSNPTRDLKVIEMAYQAGRDAVIEQLRMSNYETTHDIDESIYSDGFKVHFSQEVEIKILVDAVIDECYEEEDVNLEQLKEEIYHSVDTLLESDVLKLKQITDETQA